MMKIMDLFKSKRSRSAADIERALEDLSNESAAAGASLADLVKRRRDLLLSDASDEDIRTLDLEADRVRIRIEKIELAEPMLLDELRQTQNSHREEQWRELHKRHHAAALAYAAALRVAVDALDDFARIGAEAQSAGFARELASTAAIPPRVVHPEQVERFLFETERQHDAEVARQEGRKPTPPAAPAPPAVAAPRKYLTGALAAPKAPARAPAKISESTPPKPPRKPIADEKRDGEVRILILRDGYEDPRGRQCLMNDVVSVRDDVAVQVVQAGAADFVDKRGGAR